MKRNLLIAAVLFLTLGTYGCKQAASSAQSTNSLDSCNQTTIDAQLDSLLGESPLSRKPLKAILQQLNLNPDKCYWPFVSAQLLPDNKQLAAWVIPEVTSMDEDGAGFTLAGHTILADAETGEIKSQYYEQNAWSSDALQLAGIAIDTLGYRLNDHKVMFGVRAQCTGSSAVNPGGDTSLRLFVQQGDVLLPIFSYTMKEYNGVNDGGANGNSELEEHETDLVVTKQANNGFYDFALLTNSRWDTITNHKPKSIYSIGDSIRLFSYVGKEYKEVKKSSTTVVYNDPSEESHRESRYYYGKTLPEVYALLWEEKNRGGKNYMQKEIPQNATPGLKMELDGADYTFDSDKCLTIYTESKLGLECMQINEKANYTQVSIDRY